VWPAADPKKGKKVDPTKMLVADPSEIPEVGSAELSEVRLAKPIAALYPLLRRQDLAIVGQSCAQ